MGRRPLAILFAACAACTSGQLVVPAPPGSYLVVLDKDANDLRVVEPNRGWTRDLAPTGRGPHEVAAAYDGSLAVVTNYGDSTPGHTLSVWGFPERFVVATIDIAPHERPHGIAFLDRRSTVLVTSETSRALLEVDLNARRVTRVLDTGAEGSHMLAIAPDGSRVFVANIGAGSMSAIDLASGKLLAVVPTGRQAEAIDLSPDGREVWVGNRGEDTLSVIDAGTLAVLATIPCGRTPIRLRFTPDGGQVLVSCIASGDLAVFDARRRTQIARVALPGTDPAPIGLLVEPSGRRALVACSHTRSIAVVDLARLAVTGRIDVGDGPDGMAWARRLYDPRFLGERD